MSRGDKVIAELKKENLWEEPDVEKEMEKCKKMDLKGKINMLVQLERDLVKLDYYTKQLNENDRKDNKK